MAQQEIGVYLDLWSEPAPVCVGTLWHHLGAGRRESASFQYSKEWSRHPMRFDLEPLMSVDTGRHFTQAGQKMFGAIGDSAPDRWGQMLMRRAAAGEAAPRALTEPDYLLMVNDEARQGALRFSKDGGKTFLSSDAEHPIPPLLDVFKLQYAADKICCDQDDAADIRMVLSPGSSLGGARPKASVREKDGSLAIAKFSKTGDPYRMMAWECIALDMAAEAGLTVPPHRLLRSQHPDILLVKRFDRTPEQRRVAYLSAMSMLGALDGEEHDYSEVADAIRLHGAAPKRDLRELWKRIAFSVMISNTDDHLRNHGFLKARTQGWRLAPLFDVNPVPLPNAARMLRTAPVPGVHDASLPLLLSVAEDYEYTLAEARAALVEVASAVARWELHARRYGLTPRECELMAPAFTHEDGYTAGMRMGKR